MAIDNIKYQAQAVEEKLKTLELRALSEKKREEEVYRILTSIALRET